MIRRGWGRSVPKGDEDAGLLVPTPLYPPLKNGGRRLERLRHS